ncbi:hypothetical protein H2200_006402 [Cladophialophora chaetospira]|uniref:Pyrroline-5-carboxylate reductase n=1 Tax=Cladophialophora chaetospira TaxID=386627 RepID=A0AA38X851_9EURO|nr:hypothetical protein H2200_006402 [Cladophialophora chaetospira]
MASVSASRKLRIAILGCGFMGKALLSGILKSIDGTTHELKFSISARSQASRDNLQGMFKSKADTVDLITTDNTVAARDADVVILAFQPQQLEQVLNGTGLRDALSSKLIVSLLAGISSERLTQKVYSGQTQNSRVSRVLPSIGAQINESATLVVDDAKLSASDRELVMWLFQQVGQTQLVPEELIDTVTAVSAATHALVVVATDAIVDSSVASGVPRPVALAVASQCLRSASSLLQGHMTIESLKESMSIARGITINALLRLEKGQVRSGVSDAVTHAVQYARNM